MSCQLSACKACPEPGLKGGSLHGQGLLPVWINRSSGKFQGRELLTVGAMADSYYEYLLKTWLYTRKQV